MKTYKDFLKDRISEEDSKNEVIKASEIETLNADSLPDFIYEAGDEQNHQMPHDPPAILILRRKSIRLFPNNQRVALYYSDKLNKYVSVPYSSLGWSAKSEESEYDKRNILNDLRYIVDKQSSKLIEFNDGRNTIVNIHTASSILKTYNNLNEINKQKFLNLLSETKDSFINIVKFSRYK